MKRRRTVVWVPRTVGDGRRSAAVVALAALALIWGYNWVVMKLGLQYAQPFTFAGLRTLLSAGCLFLVMWALRRPLRPTALWTTALIGLFQTTGFVGLAFLALEHGGAGKVSVLTYTMPFWLLLLAWLVLGERVRGLQWLAVAMAAAGFLLILSPWQLRGATATLLAVGGGLSWAAGGITIKALDRRRHVDLLSLTAWQMLIGSLPLVLIALLTWKGAPIWSAGFAWTLAFNVLLANALAWYLWHFSLRALPTGLAGFGTLAIPVVGVVAAWAQLGERPGLAEALGMACIIGALALLTIRELRTGAARSGGRNGRARRRAGVQLRYRSRRSGRARRAAGWRPRAHDIAVRLRRPPAAADARLRTRRPALSRLPPDLVATRIHAQEGGEQHVAQGLAAVRRAVPHLGHPLPADPHRGPGALAAGAGVLADGPGGAHAPALRAPPERVAPAAAKVAVGARLHRGRALRAMAATLRRRAASLQLARRPAGRHRAITGRHHLPVHRRARAADHTPAARPSHWLRRRCRPRRSGHRHGRPRRPRRDGPRGARLHARTAHHQPAAGGSAESLGRCGLARDHRDRLLPCCADSLTQLALRRCDRIRSHSGGRVHGHRLPALLRPDQGGRPGALHRDHLRQPGGLRSWVECSSSASRSRWESRSASRWFS